MKKALWLAGLAVTVCLFLFVAGQFAEGPPYRVIVRGIPFISAISLISVLTAVLLKTGMVVRLVVGGLIPLGLIWSMQQYYDGGINEAYRRPVYGMLTLFAMVSGVYIYRVVDLLKRK